MVERIQFLSRPRTKTSPSTVLMIGNPGVGKSTLLNGLIGFVKFKSGTSIGNGLTTQLDKFTAQDGNCYIDTPGLDDLENIQRAASEIEKALKQGGDYRVFFVVTLESGRIRSKDKSTMKLVLEAAREIKNSFSIIVNKVPKPFHERLKKSPAEMSDLRAKLNANLPEPTERIFLHERQEAIDDVDDQMPALSDEFLRFIKEGPQILVTQDNVQQIQWDQFE